MIADYSITIAGVTQLSGVIPAGTSPTSYKLITLQADPSNSGIIYVGGANHGADVSSSQYGLSIPVPVTSIPAAPIVLPIAPAQGIDLAQLWIAGTDDDILHVLVIG